MSILDSFGKNEKSGLGGRSKGAISTNPTYSVEGSETGGDDHYSLNSHRSNPTSFSVAPQSVPQQQQQQPADGAAFDPNMFGDNASAMSSVHRSPPSALAQQPQNQYAQQQLFQSQQQEQVVHHDLECDDGDLTLDRFNNQQLQFQQQPQPPVFQHQQQQQQQYQRPVFNEGDRTAMEDFTMKDDFMERFNAASAAMRAGHAMPAQNQPQQQPQPQVGTNKRKASLPAAVSPQLVPLCPTCFSKNVRQNQSVAARQKQQQQQPLTNRRKM